MRRLNEWMAMGAGFAILLAGCGETTPPASTDAPGTAATTASPTGTVHEVQMISGSGERFAPADLEVKRGDVVRFVLVAGVHNASFPAASNPSGVDLPAATPYLQAPGQTHEMVIDLPAGEYHYQCDPHVALGMVGTVTVTD
jgi:plastocyanin